MMIYTHTINTSLESNSENDDDVIDLKTFWCDLILNTYANIRDK